MTEKQSTNAGETERARQAGDGSAAVRRQFRETSRRGCYEPHRIARAGLP